MSDVVDDGVSLPWCAVRPRRFRSVVDVFEAQSLSLGDAHLRVLARPHGFATRQRGRSRPHRDPPSHFPYPMTQPTFDVTIVIPVYGGETTLERLVDGIATVMHELSWSFEVILVCDRPQDSSWTVAAGLARERDDTTAIHLMRNFGQHPATLLGIRRARGAVIVTMDEDLQHDPRDIPALVDAARSLGGIAYGTFEQPRHSAWRNLTSRATKWFLARYVGQGIANSATAFRAFPVRLREPFDTYRGERVAIDVLLSWSGAPLTTVPAAHAPRASGESGYTLRKLLQYLGDLLVGYSVAPLRVASFLGLAAFGFAMMLGAYVLYNWLRHGSAVPGFAFVALSTSILSGAQLLTLGVIGEYLGRLYFGALGKPQYVVDEVVESSTETT